MLDREEAAGAAEAGLDFVGDEQGAVPAAKLGGRLQIAVGGHVDALALDRLDDEGRDLARRQRPLERDQVVEGDADAIGQQRLEAVAEHVVAVERQRAIGEAVIGVVAEDDARPPGRGAGELDRRLDGFGAGIGEEDLVEIGHARQQPLGQNAGERRDIHLHEIGQLAVEDAFQRIAQRRMIAADGENAEAAQQIEIARAVAVVEILACAAAEPHVIADGAQHPDHLLVEMAAVHVIAVGLAARRTIAAMPCGGMPWIGASSVMRGGGPCRGGSVSAGRNDSSTILTTSPSVQLFRMLRRPIRQRHA